MAEERKGQPQFSTPKGYFIPDKEARGVWGPLYKPVTYNEASNFETPYYRDIQQSVIQNGYTSPLTTKGDVFTYDTSDTRLAVGSNTQVLVADSAESKGIRWTTKYDKLNVFRREAYSQVHGTDSAAIISVGHNIGNTETGTKTHIQDSTGRYANYESSGALNSEAGVQQSGADVTQTQLGPVVSFVIKTGPNAIDLTDVRIRVGLFSGTNPLAADTLGAGFENIAFRYCTGVDATAFWRVESNDSGATPNVTTTTTAITVDTRYEMRIDARDSASVKFYINGSRVATHTSDLPTTTTGLVIYQKLRGLTADVRNFRFARVHWTDD